MYHEKYLDPRQCIEETILHFKPDISDKELLDLRERIFLSVFGSTPGNGCYSRDYYLLTRKKFV